MSVETVRDKIFNSPRSLPLRIELRDPFGQIIGKPMIIRQPGPGALSHFFEAEEREELRVPFVAPGANPAAAFYFVITTNLAD